MCVCGCCDTHTSAEAEVEEGEEVFHYIFKEAFFPLEDVVTHFYDGIDVDELGAV